MATKTISQGDTRSSGLKWICHSGGTIYAATKSIKWPGPAAVFVSVVHLFNGSYDGRCRLDGRDVAKITAYLFDQGDSEDPVRLRANQNLSFKGMEPYGKGFLFDDGDSKSTPLAVMDSLVRGDPRNSQVISPYIGGDELVSDPRHQHHRYVINFGEMTKEQAQTWPDLFDILEKKVKPERATKAPEVAAWPFWRFWRVRNELLQAIRSKQEILAHPFNSKYLGFVFLPSSTIVASPHVVFAISERTAFCVMQSDLHDCWIRFFGSSLGVTLRYTPSDCFETFPFPASWQTNEALERIGREYYAARARIMIARNEGLTDVYNCFHDRDNKDEDIRTLRELHIKLNRTVLDAYGWQQMKPEYEFVEIAKSDDDDEAESGPDSYWRYGWKETFRENILSRLLKLNRASAEEEAQSAPAAPEAKAAGKRGRKSIKGAPVANHNLFEVQESSE